MKANKLLLLILTLTVFLRLPTLFEPHWYFDEGIYAVVGSRWVQGASLYTDIWDHKPPGLFVIYGIGYVIEKISTLDILVITKILVCIAVTLTQIALFQLGREIAKREAYGICAAVLYGTLVSLPLWEGYMANGEIFLVAFSCWGIYKVTQNANRPPASLCEALRAGKAQSSFLGGLLIGLAILVKPVAIAEALLCTLWVMSLRPRWARRSLHYLATGLITPLVVTGLYFLYRGTFTEFIHANLLYNLKYSTSNTFPLEQDLILNILRLCSLVIVAYLAYLTFRNKKSLTSLVLIWFFLDLLVISLSLRPYIHYLIQAFPPLVLLTVLLISKLRPFELNRISTIITTQFPLYWLLATSYLLLILIPLNQKLNITDNIPYQFNQFAYYTNFLKFTSGRITESEYVQFFEHNVTANAKIVSFIKEYSSIHPLDQSDQVFIWGGGEAPWLYYELGRLGLTPATRFANHFHAETMPHGFRETMNKLTVSPPKLITLFSTAADFPELENFINEKYQCLKTINEATIFIRRVSCPR